MADRRKCWVYKWMKDPGGARLRVFDCEAWFHQWGQEIEEDERGYSTYTVAIVEKAGGEVATVLPLMIEFK